MESTISENLQLKNTRIDWIDVSKAFAIFFIYFGHWVTKNGNLEIFSYSFHLQLFFIISGFFAIKQQKNSALEFVKKQAYMILIPFAFFVVLNTVYFNLDGEKTINDISLNIFSNLTDFSHSVAPELWFLPALFCVTIFYFFMFKLLRNPLVILMVAYVLYIIKVAYPDEVVSNILVPFIKFLGISSIPEYLIWYSLGAIAFPFIRSSVENLESGNSIKKNALNIIGFLLIVSTIMIYSFKPDGFWNKALMITGQNSFVNNSFVYTNFKIIITLIICSAFFFISYLFRNSQILLLIGKNTIILLGFEFLVKNFLVLNVFPMFNIGIITLETTVQVMTISVLTIICVIPLFKPMNKHIPFLIGRR